jgi:hypothetical protein
MSSIENWPFDQGPEVAALTTRQVLDRESPIRYVIHYPDDHSWAFLCGTTNETDDYRMIHMHHALEMDPSLSTIADLELGWSAWREDQHSPWERFQEDLGTDDESS